MADNELRTVPVRDVWDTLPEDLRETFVTRHAAMNGRWVEESPDRGTGNWDAMRPVILQKAAYRALESSVARVLTLAVEACQRRASTLGELRDALRFTKPLPLVDPDAPLVASELTRSARPDLLIENGRPRILEINVGTRIGGDTVTSWLAEEFCRLCPEAGFYPPPSVVATRSEALLRTIGGHLTQDGPRRVLIPSYWTANCEGVLLHRTRAKRGVLADAKRVGLEVLQTDLADLSLDAAGRLLAAGVPVDLVMVPWTANESARIVDAGEGLAALRSADRAGTIKFFPRTESVLLASKSVLAWLHEDCDADLLAPADRELVRAYVPRTISLGLGETAAAPGPRANLVLKPAMGRAGKGVLFGSVASEEEWLEAAVEASKDAPVVLQERVEADLISMPFLDRESGRQVTVRVPYVLSPYMIDRAVSDIGVRHSGPDSPVGDVVISVSKGGRSNAVVLTG
ncbi:hypothetical protein GCM10023321_84650 [Pseudonocardia eucalypti]|uniref:Circularly permuted type 2 ATP-grasp protein n=1 Tax=Pseudonocardia eucalypti TaxID=648755 RepID=A0ABP9RGM6_9PSEU|nr:hypothetical protein [Pseudonocardia eucalypti]